MNNEEKKQLVAQWVKESSRIVFFGGAGVSTESGIPDFRSVDGLYNQQYDYPPEEILSHHFFMNNPDEFYRFYWNKMIAENAKPNPAHLTLAKWEAEGRLLAVVTQNIDGLHQMAGSKRVYELHGTVHKNRCMKCGKMVPLSEIEKHEGIPRCTCGGILKPEVVLYEEGLDDATVSGAVRSIAQADLLIIGGTSLTVYPAAGFVHYFRGKHLVLMNKTPTAMDAEADLVITEPIGQVLGSL